MRWGVWLSTEMSYADASQVLSEVGQIDISASSLWRQVEDWGNRLLAQETQARDQANAMPGRGVPQRGETRHTQPMGVSVDGFMVYIRGEGWKEVKAGAIFRVVQQVGYDAQTREPLTRAVAKGCSYVAHLGGPEVFGEKLWREAVDRRVPGAYDKVWVSDAAAWIWNLCQYYLPEAEQIVDWYHALEHLHQAANLLYGEGTEHAGQWARRMVTQLYQGQAVQLAHQLELSATQLTGQRADQLRAEATFFRNNHRRMRYMEYRENGYPIGSGTIESACKQFQSRLKGPGMRWSRTGADRMLALRAQVLTGCFNQTWITLQNSPAS
jgi:hypothetical protein